MRRARRLGLVLGGATHPAQLVPAAVAADRLGFDELWFSEDCFFTGGISAATAALASTSRIQVGLGIVSAMLRHPALLAMELATMAGVYPDRLVAGVGLGVPAWLRQVGRHPRSPITAMTECVTSVRGLLAGDQVTADGREFSFAGVALAHPPRQRLPIYLGVSGPKLLQLSGAIADGSILSVCAGPNYLRWARAQIAAGQASAGRDERHQVVAFALYSVDADRDRARDRVRDQFAFYLSADAPNAITNAEGISAELTSLLARHGPGRLASELPDEWLAELTVSGTPQDCAEQLVRLYDAGADSVALFGVWPEQAEEVARITSREVMPLLRGRA